MNKIGEHRDSAPKREEGFSFFPHREIDSLYEGREPHAVIKDDPFANQFPKERQIGWFLFLSTFAFYLASMSWTAFPGWPTRELLAHLEPGATRSALDPAWGMLVRLFARLPWMPVASWAGGFGALCGAASAALLGRLMVRVGYVIRNEPGRESLSRQAQARRLSGFVSGLYLAGSIPFWTASTRSLPGAFHILLLLAAMWAFSEYQHWGRLRSLFLTGLFCGFGVTEFPTFIFYLPVILFLVAREMFRWRALATWRAQLTAWSGMGLGLLAYPVHAIALYREGATAGSFTSPWETIAQVLQEQIGQILRIPFGLQPYLAIVSMVLLILSLVPWLVLFVLSHRSPWFYERWQVLLRLLLVFALMGPVFLPIWLFQMKPEVAMGMSYLLITPFLLMAACMGYLAGEFWVLGEPQSLLDTDFTRRVIRRTTSGFALLIPLAIVAGGIVNWRVVDGRHGNSMDSSVDEILERLEGRDILFSAGVLDDSIRLAVWERKLPVLVVSAPRTPSSLYLLELAKHFTEDYLRQPLLLGDFGAFLDNLLMSPEGPSRIGIIDMPEVFREFGYLAPDGFVYRLEPSADRVDVSALVESQRPFWARMERIAQHPILEVNLARPYQDQMRLLASKMANNLAVMQLERGDVEGGLDTLRTARRISPENLSVLMNLMEAGRDRGLPESAELEAEWTEFQDQPDWQRWALSIRYGYLWNAREWVKRSFVWALSGAPDVAEAARRKSSSLEQDMEATARLIDQAYLTWGTPFRNESYHRAQLMKDGRKTTSLLGLAQLALRRNDLEAADAYLAEAIAMGLPEEQTAFDRAMAAHLQGDTEKALAGLVELTRQTPGDMRVWMALLLLSDEQDPVNAEAMKVLKGRGGLGVSERLALAWVHISRRQLADAQAELDNAIHIDSRNTQAWEMMGMLAQDRGNRAMMEASQRALLLRDPEHFLQYLNQGVLHYQNDDLEQAELAFRKGIQRRRDSVLLNNLADVLIRRGGDLQEALALIDEAILRNPGQPRFLSTRGEIYLELDRFEDARKDLQEALEKLGREENLLLLLALSYEGLGDRTRALTLANALESQPEKMSDKQRQQVRELLARLAASVPPGSSEPPADLRQDLDRINEALRRTPGNGELLGERGETHFRMGRFEEARQDLREALKIEGRNSRWLLRLAQSCEKLGDRERALAVAKALALHPEQLDAAQKQAVKDLLLRLR